jgi:hypothetical protein
MSVEYDLAQDKEKIRKLLEELREALGESPAYLGTQTTSVGYQGATPAGSYTASSWYQGSDSSPDPSGGLDPAHLKAVIVKLESCAERVSRCLDDRVDNVGDLRSDGKLNSQKPSAQLRSGEKDAGNEAEECRELLSAIAFWIREGRAALSRISSPSLSRTPRNGLARLVNSAMSRARRGGPEYAVGTLHDDTVYRMNEYRPTEAELSPNPAPTPYLGRRFNDRDVSIEQKVLIGNALKPRSLPSMYLPTKTYEIPEYPPKPMERASYDRYERPLNY